VQPNLQWIINPGGTGNIPNALVLGAQMSVSF
jgi:carbohydrate-selective porin OprB